MQPMEVIRTYMAAFVTLDVEHLNLPTMSRKIVAPSRRMIVLHRASQFLRDAQKATATRFDD